MGIVLASYPEPVPLVEPTDLAKFRGAPFSKEVIDAAAQSIRTECDWHIAPNITSSVKLRGGGSAILLPSLHVTDVLSVTDNHGNLIHGWDWMPSGTLERADGFPPFVTVVFTHGYRLCPRELLPIIAERANAQATGRIVSESLAGRAVSLEAGYDPVTSGVLAKYTLNGGA